MMELAAFKNRHRDEQAIVCACGESALQLHDPHRFVTIGISDVGRIFPPRYLLVANYEYQYSAERFKYIEDSQAEYLFTPLINLKVGHKNVVRFRAGKFAGTDLSRSDVLPCSSTSAYMALCLAAHMGANPIGLVGVDFTDNHFFEKSGTHPLAGDLATIDSQFRALNLVLHNRGIKVVNLSRRSRITAFEKGSLEYFATIGSVCS